MWRLLCTLVAVWLVVGSPSALAQTAPNPAVPVEAVEGIVDAFHTTPLVALGEGEHGNRQGHEFRLALLRDPRFNGVVNDIVVEFGNSLYQDVMDRFVLDGADVPYAQLRKVWENTTQPFTTFDSPIYREFFEAVRALNLTRPRERRIRVLLGDPPIDWEAVKSQADVQKWLALRDITPVEIIRREVLARQRRALLIYGDLHFQRKSIDFNYADRHGLLTDLEASRPRLHVFNIWTNTAADLQRVQDVSRWPVPSLALTHGTVLGGQDFTFYYQHDDSRVRDENGRFVPIPRAQWQHLSMDQQFDAVLYLGPPSSIGYVGLDPALCDDPAYMEMRVDRFTLLGMTKGVERLKEYCATHKPK